MKTRLLSMTICFVLASLVTRANSGTDNAGDESKKNDLTGGVIHADTRKPISNVSVTAYTNNHKEAIVITDANGNYTFNDLKSGTYRLVFEKNGFKKVV